MNEIEISLVNSFFDKSVKDRALILLNSKKGRPSFVESLRNFSNFDEAHKKSISIEEKDFVKSTLYKHSINGNVFVISIYEEFDGRWIDINVALKSLFGFLGGTIMASEDLKCIYYEGEFYRNRCLVELK